MLRPCFASRLESDAWSGALQPSSSREGQLMWELYPCAEQISTDLYNLSSESKAEVAVTTHAFPAEGLN